MKKNRYEDIMKQAAMLIGKKGYDGTSFQDIANSVGVHKSTLFYYFKTKEELILTAMERSIHGPIMDLQQIVTREGLTPEERLKQALENHIRLIIAHADTVNIYLNELRRLPRRDQAKYLNQRKMYEKDFETIIRQMQGAGYFQGLNTKIVAFGILGMANWVIKWFKTGGEFTVSEVANIFYRMVTQNHQQGPSESKDDGNNDIVKRIGTKEKTAQPASSQKYKSNKI